MSGGGPRLVPWAVGGLLLASAVTGAVAYSVAIRRARAVRAARLSFVRVAPIAAPAVPIAEEAGVFHTVATALALAPAAPRERSAHPRTWTTYRFLRAYPGAPPRIPHPLSAEEFRSGTCRTCHERGGYSSRFAAYVPLTPHAERGRCLQCHVGVDSVLGFAVPGVDPSSRCGLCHAGGGRPRPEASTTWPWAVWRALPRTIPGQLPPPIPHDLQTRQNCLACHGGPAAVAEFRTSHPERTDCRQCHVTLGPGSEPFTRSPLRSERQDAGA